MGEPGSPRPPPAGGFGRARPVRRGVGNPGFPTPPTRGRVRAGAALLRRPPPPSPAPAGGGNRAPPPSGGRLRGGKPGFPLPLRMRAGGPRTHAPAPGKVRAQPVRRGVGKPGFPTPPTRGRVREGKSLLRRPPLPSPAPAAGGNRAPPPSGGRLRGGKPGFPLALRMRAGGPRTHAAAPGKVRAQPVRRGVGNPGFPTPPPRGRVWAGKALPGTTILFVCGAAATGAAACFIILESTLK